MADVIPTTILLNAKDNTRPAFAKLDRNLKKANIQTKRLDSGYNNLTGSVIRATVVLVAFTAAAAAIGGSIGAAKRFGKQMAEISTLIDTTKESLTDYADVVDDLIKTYGGDFQTTSKALYDTISAGAGTVAEATTILKAANVAAIAGVSDIATATDALTTILNSYSMSASNATAVSDLLFATVKAGKTTLGEIAPAIGKVTPLAASMGVSFAEVGAAIATVTATGLSTSEVVTSLKAVIANIIKPTADAAAMAEHLGFSFTSANLRAKGFGGFMAELKEKTEAMGVAPVEAIEKLFGSVEGLNTALALAANGGKAFEKNLSLMGRSAGMTAEAFAKMTGTFDFQWNAMVGKIKVGAKNFGSVFTDFLIKPLMHINDNFQIWGFQIEHTFAQVMDVTDWLVDGVILQFKKWQGAFDWIVDKVITPISDGFKDLYEKVVGSSYVPELVRDVIFWFDKWSLLASNILGFFINPLIMGFQFLTASVGVTLDFMAEKFGFLELIKLPGIADWFGGWEPKAKEASNTLADVATIFSAATATGLMRKFFGVSIILLAWKLYDGIVNKITGYSNALKANRLIAFQAAQANNKALKEQQKFFEDRKKFAGEYGKQLQKIMNSGGSRSLVRRFFGGSDEWTLAQAKAKDAINGAKAAMKGISIDAKGKAKQSFLNRVIFGKLSQEEILGRINESTDAMKKAQTELNGFGAKQRGFFAIAKNGFKEVGLSFLRTGEAAKNLGGKLSIVGNKIRLIGTANTPIKKLEGAFKTLSTVAINELGKISPKAAVAAESMRMKFVKAIQMTGSAIKHLGGDIVSMGGRFNGVIRHITQGVAAGKAKIMTFVPRGLVSTAVWGAKGFAAGSKLVLKGAKTTFMKVAGMAGRARSMVTGGLMAGLMFGGDLTMAAGAAKATKDTGNFFKNIQAQTSAAVDAIPSTSLAMLAMFGPIGAVIGIAALAFKHWDTIKAVFNNFIAWIGQQDWGKILLEAFVFAADGLLAIGTWITDMTIKGIMAVGSAFADLGIWIWDQIVDAFTFDDFGTEFMKSLKSFGSEIVDLFLTWNPLALWFKGIKEIASLVGLISSGPTAQEKEKESNNPMAHMATGGQVKGAGTATSDSIAAMLSNGEFIVNADSTEKFLPLLEMINKPQGFRQGGSARRDEPVKKGTGPTSSGGTLVGGATLESIFAKSGAATAKNQFIATFGNVDFSEARKFLNSLFGFKLSVKDIEGMDPVLLQQITQSMRKLEETTTTTVRDLEGFTPASTEMSNALQVSSSRTAEWQAELVDLIEPLIAVKDEQEKYAAALKESAEALLNFGDGWRETMEAWRAGFAVVEDGKIAAGQFIELISGVTDTLVDSLAESTNLKDLANNIKDFFTDFLENTAKDVAKRSIKSAISGAIPGLNDAGEGQSNVFNATGQVLMNVTGPVTMTGGNIGAAGGTGGGFAASILGALGGGSSSSSADPGVARQVSGYAKGGIPPVGQVSLVGEKGPELFMPSQKGRIIPNNQIKNMNNQAVNINQTLNISEATNPEQFQKELAKNNQNIVSMVQRSYERRGKNGGPLG